jgi:hypothetical protein
MGLLYLLIIGLANFWTDEGKKHSPEFLAKEFR